MTGGLALRLSFNGADGPKVDSIVEALRSAGFDILGASARGVDARAPREVIEGFFGVPIAGGGQPRFAAEPKDGRLPPGPDYRAYFPRRPELF
jgi:hypothetical protein